jgi:hypothetical protein
MARIAHPRLDLGAIGGVGLGGNPFSKSLHTFDNSAQDPFAQQLVAAPIDGLVVVKSTAIGIFAHRSQRTSAIPAIHPPNKRLCSTQSASTGWALRLERMSGLGCDFKGSLQHRPEISLLVYGIARSFLGARLAGVRQR